MGRPVRSRTQNLGVSALAKELNLPQSTVSHMMGRGKSVDEVRIYAALRHGDPTPGTPPGTPAEMPPTKSEYDLVVQTREMVNELEHWKMRRAKALARKSEIENFVRTGDLLPKAYIRKHCLKHMMAGRDEIERMPSELADALAAESDVGKVRVILAAYGARIVAHYERLYQFFGQESATAEEQVA